MLVVIFFGQTINSTNETGLSSTNDGQQPKDKDGYPPTIDRLSKDEDKHLLINHSLPKEDKEKYP